MDLQEHKLRELFHISIRKTVFYNLWNLTCSIKRSTQVTWLVTGVETYEIFSSGRPRDGWFESDLRIILSICPNPLHLGLYGQEIRAKTVNDRYTGTRWENWTCRVKRVNILPFLSLRMECPNNTSRSLYYICFVERPKSWNIRDIIYWIKSNRKNKMRHISDLLYFWPNIGYEFELSYSE